MIETGVTATPFIWDFAVSYCKQSPKFLTVGFVYFTRWKLTDFCVFAGCGVGGAFYHTWEEPGQGAGARQRPREIDFLTTQPFSDAGGKLRISPIEVKSSKSYSTVSLDDFKGKCGKRVGKEVVLHPKQFKAEGNRLYLPLYMSGLL